jgi:ubiquinone biosynthesis protein UbiJ
VQIEGDAEFANTISQLSKGLRWEAEADLEKLVGPMAAVRVAGGARAVFNGARTLHRKFTENMAEFLVEEQPMLTKHNAVEDFGGDVVRLRDDVERTAKRIARIEQQLAQRSRAGAIAGQPNLDME